MLLQVDHVSRSFGANRAVDDVSLTISNGEVVGLVGENGAGKTTLMRIVAGELAPSSGSFVLDGRAELVHQHFMLVGSFSIAANLALSSPHLFLRDVEGSALRIIAETGIALPDVTRLVDDLSVGEKAKLELIKAIARRPALLILDEPTSVLTPHETAELFRVISRLASSGTAVVFISHKLPEVLEVAQRVVVMRRGRVVVDGGRMSAAELASAMVVTSPAPAPASARNGSILAIVGVAGNGQTELAGRLRAAHPDGAHIPEDRTRDGLVADMTIAENIALKAPRWHPREAVARAAQLIDLYGIRAHGPSQRAGSLSGGNQQKVILARELSRNPRVIVAAEPTRGLDLEATRFVHDQLRTAAANGAAITLITSDLDEAFALADAIQVIYRGRLSERMTPEEASTRVASLMAGVA
ncbi:MAG TPA: ATP-binding cassette domain-containing protein [Thermoanaerobaculia bacterium]|nr:ATP-binding cassette domain-containing protein [Thermoanaerobaculia bacterium]